MTDLRKITAIRSLKVLHYVLSVLLFAGTFRLFYSYILLENQVTLRYGTMICIYCVIFLFSVRTYSAYNVGAARIRMLIYSQFLADMVSGAIIYLLLWVNRRELLNPVPLMVAIVLQVFWNCLWSYCATGLYFRLNKARRTVIVYRNEADLQRLREVYEYSRRFRVTKEIKDPEDDIHALAKELEGAEAVFVVGVPATLRNGIAKHCVQRDIRCYVLPHVGDVIMMGAKHVELFSVPVYRIMRAKPKVEYSIVKRAMDILLSLTGIILLSPFMLITALAIKCYDGGPVLYKQVRLTKDGREFEILKFRSMRVDAEKDGVARLASENDDRITPVGKVIRACRLDELPQLLNILRGDMSIVGPRPERPEIAEQYEQIMPAFSLRLQVKAGLTGFAQVYGRYNTDPYDKLRMDLMYINQMSFMQDLKLMFATVKVLFMRESTSGVEEGRITAVTEEEFTLR